MPTTTGYMELQVRRLNITFSHSATRLAMTSSSVPKSQALCSVYTRLNMTLECAVLGLWLVNYVCVLCCY